jgi:transposase InsO family protein
VQKTVHGTKREAERELARFVTEVSDGARSSTKSTSVGELLEQWFSHNEADWSPTVVNSYRRIIDRQLVPRFGRTQYTSWAFGRRLRSAGLLGSMGSIGDCFDNSVAESFFGSLQLELLDEHHRHSREHLALAIFDWIEAWYNPRRRHSYCNMLSPIDYETADAA